VIHNLIHILLYHDTWCYVNQVCWNMEWQNQGTRRQEKKDGCC